MSELLDIAQRVVDQAGGDEQVEAYVVREITTELQARAGGLESLSSAEARGVGVRVVVDGRQGYAFTAVVDAEGLAEALDEARTNAAVATPDEANGLPEPADVPDLEGLVDAGFATTSVEDRIALALAFDAAVRGADPRVIPASTINYGDAHSEVAIASTKGVSLTGERTDAWAYAEAIVRDGEESRTGMGLTMGAGPGQLDVEAAGREGVERAIRLLGATKPPSGKLAVVFDPLVTAQFLGVLASALSAEAVLKGRSLFAGRLGDEVAASGVTLYDDGLLVGAPGTAPFDGEGVPCQTTALVEAGTLASYLHNTWTARRTGDGAVSTGNAHRAGFKSSPTVAPSNLYLADDGTAAADVIGRVDDGVYVQDVMGLHSGANPISGEFSVSFSGLRISGGELGAALNEAAVSSTIVEVLRAIEAVAADRRFFPFGGSLGGATVLINEMSVSGS